MQEIEKEQQARDQKTSRLRALRLAKEAADKEHADKDEVEQLAAAEETIKSSKKKSAGVRKRSAASKVKATVEPTTQHG